MANSFQPPPTQAMPQAGQHNPEATVVEGLTQTGRPCRVVDNTGTIAVNDLEALLASLIAERRFGLGRLGAQGGDRIPINEPTGTHIQFGERLYRVLLFPYEARIEAF